MTSFDERGFGMTNFLQMNAGKDPRHDAYLSGYITAVKDLLGVDWETVND